MNLTLRAVTSKVVRICPTEHMQIQNLAEHLGQQVVLAVVCRPLCGNSNFRVSWRDPDRAKSTVKKPTSTTHALRHPTPLHPPSSSKKKSRRCWRTRSPSRFRLRRAVQSHSVYLLRRQGYKQRLGRGGTLHGTHLRPREGRTVQKKRSFANDGRLRRLREQQCSHEAQSRGHSGRVAAQVRRSAEPVHRWRLLHIIDVHALASADGSPLWILRATAFFAYTSCWNSFIYLTQPGSASHSFSFQDGRFHP